MDLLGDALTNTTTISWPAAPCKVVYTETEPEQALESRRIQSSPHAAACHMPERCVRLITPPPPVESPPKPQIHLSPHTLSKSHVHHRDCDVVEPQPRTQWGPLRTATVVYIPTGGSRRLRVLDPTCPCAEYKPAEAASLTPHHPAFPPPADTQPAGIGSLRTVLSRLVVDAFSSPFDTGPTCKHPLLQPPSLRATSSTNPAASTPPLPYRHHRRAASDRPRPRHWATMAGPDPFPDQHHPSQGPVSEHHGPAGGQAQQLPPVREERCSFSLHSNPSSPSSPTARPTRHITRKYTMSSPTMTLKFSPKPSLGTATTPPRTHLPVGLRRQQRTQTSVP